MFGKNQQIKSTAADCELRDLFNAVHSKTCAARQVITELSTLQKTATIFSLVDNSQYYQLCLKDMTDTAQKLQNILCELDEMVENANTFLENTKDKRVTTKDYVPFKQHYSYFCVLSMIEGME